MVESVDKPVSPGIEPLPEMLARLRKFQGACPHAEPRDQVLAARQCDKCLLLAFGEVWREAQEAERDTLDSGERERLHLMLEECYALIDPEEHFELCALLGEELTSCNADTHPGAVERIEAMERERIVGTVRTFLLHDSQRAVSWHEVQDCIEAIRAVPKPEGKPKETR